MPAFWDIVLKSPPYPIANSIPLADCLRDLYFVAISSILVSLGISLV